MVISADLISAVTSGLSLLLQNTYNTRVSFDRPSRTVVLVFQIFQHVKCSVLNSPRVNSFLQRIFIRGVGLLVNVDSDGRNIKNSTKPPEKLLSL